MDVWMLWNGGSGYAAPYIDDVERHKSLGEAKARFEGRIYNPFYPCVEAVPVDDGGPEGHVFFSDPRDTHDPYPDRILSFGPRGGVRCERC